ncbi:MAG: hypothetical protein ABSC05_27175 [Candidatus Solibacter sp.]
MHQGDLEGMKGVHHHQCRRRSDPVAGSAVHQSEAWLMPVLEAIFLQLPFQLLGFHSDDGSEFMNHKVAKMLTTLLVEQTKSRPRHSNDNGLVEAKNGAVIATHTGYKHIGSHTTRKSSASSTKRRSIRI